MHSIPGKAGAIILFSEEERETPVGDSEIKTCETVAAFIREQLLK